MLNLPKNQIVRVPLRIRNPGERMLVVWLEPWVERYELAPNESIDIVLVGPKRGLPEILPRSDEVLVYGWEGAEVFAFQNGRPAGRQPTVDEIVRQELDIAKEHVQRTNEPLPVEEIEMAQAKLDMDPGMTRVSQDVAYGTAAFLMSNLASIVVRSDAATNVLWEIASRLIGTKGLALAAPGSKRQAAAVWRASPSLLEKLVRKQALSALPSLFGPNSGKFEKPLATPQPAESESDSTLG
jgi:hypothetical protein